MAIDWGKLQSAIDANIANAVTQTNDELASKFSSISGFTDEELKSMFPTPADMQKFKDLMQIVKSAGDYNNKVSRLVTNLQSLGETAAKLLVKLA